MNKMKYFAFCLLQLIDVGEREQLADIVQHINNGTIVSYLVQKYSDCFGEKDFSNRHTVEEYFSSCKGDLENFAGEKFGITGENSGLLFLLALIINA